MVDYARRALRPRRLAVHPGSRRPSRQADKLTTEKVETPPPRLRLRLPPPLAGLGGRVGVGASQPFAVYRRGGLAPCNPPVRTEVWRNAFRFSPYALGAGSRKPRGSTGRFPWRNSKWSCGSVTPPVAPTFAIVCP